MFNIKDIENPWKFYWNKNKCNKISNNFMEIPFNGKMMLKCCMLSTADFCLTALKFSILKHAENPWKFYWNKNNCNKISNIFMEIPYNHIMMLKCFMLSTAE